MGKGGPYDLFMIEKRVLCFCRTDETRLIRRLNIRGPEINFRINGHCFDTHAVTGPDNSNGYLAPVGN